jgi:hypothetical protein
MKFYRLSILLFLISCNGGNNTPIVKDQEVVVTKTQAPTLQDQGVTKIQDQQILVKDQEIVVKDQEIDAKIEPIDIDKKLTAPVGVDCHKFFTEEGVEDAKETGKLYISDKQYMMMEGNGDYAIVFKLGYSPLDDRLILVASTIGVKKVCYKADSQIMIGLWLDEKRKTKEGYVLFGSHKKNCGTAKNFQQIDKGAMAVYPIPLRSRFFQDALIYKSVGAFALTDKKDKGILVEHMTYSVTSDNLRNGLRCAYRALGYEYMLFKDLEENRLNRLE